MHETVVRMAKIMIVVVTCSVIVIMTSGMSILKETYYWRLRYFRMQWEFLTTELQFMTYRDGGAWSAFSRALGDTDSSDKMSTGQASSVPILLYHGIIDDPSWTPDEVNSRLSDFRDQMFALKLAGYRTISVEEYLRFMKGELTLPDKSFMLTFDDGRKDSFYHGDPVLRVTGFTAVMNVITGRSLGVGNESGTFHLSRMELEKMIESKRWEMESHGRDDHDYETIDPDGTKGHYLSNKLWLPDEVRMETTDEFEKRITNDLVRSRLDLEKQLGVKVLAFAYPFGDFGQETGNFPESKKLLTQVARAVYPVDFTQTGSSEFPVNYRDVHAEQATRINVSSPFSASELTMMLEQAREKPVAYVDGFSENSGWLPGWGSIRVGGGELQLGATDGEDSGLTFLAGSRLWKDYAVGARVHVENGQAFTMAGRYRDGGNYVACSYYDTRIVLTQKSSGRDDVESEVRPGVDFQDGKSAMVGMRLQGSRASCLLDGKEIVSDAVGDGLDVGGVSFNIWNTVPDARSELHVSDFSVTPL